MAQEPKHSSPLRYKRSDNIEHLLRCGPVVIFDEVETYSTPRIGIKILRCESEWFVAWVDLHNSERSKVLACIDFEQASYVFDACLSKLKEYQQ